MALLRRLPISQVNHVPPTGLLSFIGLLVEAGSSNVNTKNLFKVNPQLKGGRSTGVHFFLAICGEMD
jgi:hypothetical protein